MTKRAWMMLVLIVGVAAWLGVAERAVAACETCYECDYGFDVIPECCVIGQGRCEVLDNRLNCTQVLGVVSGCYTAVNPITGKEYCGAYHHSCTSGGSGGGVIGGGGGGGGGSCSYGPGNPYCPPSCASCSWNPFVY
ncbi:MAG: hypothetical protein AAGD38_08290 [Acidobacteriota bacterium]